MQDGLERALDELVQLRPDFDHLANAGRDAIVVEDLRKTYPDGTEAVRGVTLRVARGECYGLLGPNGAGKSTTVGMLGTLVRPTSGRAVVAGSDVVEQPREARRRMASRCRRSASMPSRQHASCSSCKAAYTGSGVPRRTTGRASC